MKKMTKQEKANAEKFKKRGKELSGMYSEYGKGMHYVSIIIIIIILVALISFFLTNN